MPTSASARREVMVHIEADTQIAGVQDGLQERGSGCSQ